MSNLTIPAVPTVNKSAEQTSTLHNYLLKIANSDAPYPNPIGEAEPLISYNGYYALNNTGAFLSIDTNLVVKNGVITPHVSIIYSQDGTSSNVYDLTGSKKAFDTVTWSGTTLKAQAGIDSAVPSFTLNFTREDNNQEITSTLSGQITRGASQLIVPIKGSTYNNPIPMAMYAGTYHKEDGKGAAILQIGTDNKIKYNYDNTIGNGGELQDVQTFIYNLNMYVFSFSNPIDKDLDYSIIMGTSAKGGMVCNDLFSIKNTKISIPRSIQTVTSTPVIKPVSVTNPKSEALAKFAGFYRINSSASIINNAFLSIEGQYKSVEGQPTVYTVTIGVSLDGTSSTVYTFDDTMTFEEGANGSVLTIPITDPVGSNLTINFTRQYKKAYPNAASYYGSVVNISGSYNVAQFEGESLLNVVPLMGFAGAPLKITSSSTETIVIKSSTEIEYKGVPYKNITVVPLMYIVGFIDNNENEIIFSLGTDGGKGNTSITTAYKTEMVNGKREKGSFISLDVYTAIPDGDSGAPQH
ncbi:hypothetical protein [Olleya sp. Bg11-27]|uniref:hypothetical protein n=1 Tax=Olleya sp. Bg11-27 TaxID=2058135 RepID=UPI000C30A2B2|nr:hypothetical protein [Olleya sp. Bg11-27]AUC74927.1 hypothetical protein CW732_04255 [Olleya sp. Bg11-27]